MAYLDDTDRARIYRGLMRYWSRRLETTTVSKAELRAAVDATDAWIEDNQSVYNAALPAAFRDSASVVQKTVLFCAVALMRVGVTWLRKALGVEVDNG